MADFPKELSIKYLVNSFRGDMAIVTENEEVGCPPLSPLPFCSAPKPRGLSFPPLHQSKRAQEREHSQGPWVMEGQQKLHL